MSTKQKVLKATAQNVSKVAADYGEVEADELNTALASGNASKINEATRTLGKSILEMKRKEEAISDIIPDVHQWHKKFTISELQDVHTAVKSTIDTWLKKYSYPDWESAPLLHKKAKLEQEIKALISSKKYATWEVAEKAYTRKLADVQNAIDFDTFSKTLEGHKKFLSDSGTKSIKYKNGIKKLEAAIAAKDKSASQLLISELNAQQTVLENKKAAKASGVITAPKSTNNTLQKAHVGSGLTSNERIEAVKKLTGVTDDTEAKDYVDAVRSFSYQWDYEIRQIQCGNSVTSRHGHTLAEIKKKAKDLELFIAKSPQWNGGTTYRGMSLSDKELENLRTEMKSGNGDMLGSASWSTAERVSRGFASSHLNEKSPVYGDIKTNKVVLVTERHKKSDKHKTPFRVLSRGRSFSIFRLSLSVY